MSKTTSLRVTTFTNNKSQRICTKECKGMQEVNTYLQTKKQNYQDSVNEGHISQERFDEVMISHDYVVERVVTETAEITSVKLEEIEPLVTLERG